MNAWKRDSNIRAVVKKTTRHFVNAKEKETRQTARKKTDHICTQHRELSKCQLRSLSRRISGKRLNTCKLEGNGFPHWLSCTSHHANEAICENISMIYLLEPLISLHSFPSALYGEKWSCSALAAIFRDWSQTKPGAGHDQGQCYLSTTRWLSEQRRQKKKGLAQTLSNS